MLQLHRAERTDVLADALADVLAIPLADPMTTEIVAVPARGVERWLAQRLALRLGAGVQRDGIAANIDFRSPAALTDSVIGGLNDAAAVAAWGPERSVWHVLAALDEQIDTPAMVMLARHVGVDSAAAADDPRAGRRYATARHIAELFDGYARHRPAMLAGWALGDSSDGAGDQLPGDMAWQPDFWRAVRARIGVAHPVEDLATVCAALRSDPSSIELPSRISIFGPTRIGETFRQVAAALSAHRDVHLFVPHPGPALWRAVATAARPSDRRRSSWRAPELANPLLASLSHDVQELQLCIAGDVTADRHHPAPDAQRSVLHAVQHGIRDDLSPRRLRGSLTPDESVEIHSCHGPERQVEALRDRLLHLFDADPTLQPRDVIVMCPDVETFAPLLRGAFGQHGIDHPASALRVRLADRGLRHVNPVLDVLAAVVELAVGRASASEVADLLAREPVRRRFAMTDDDLDWVRECLVRSGIRWGIDDTQRARFGLSGLAQGTFEAGLDRIALGVVAEEDSGEWLGTALPLEGVESTQIDLTGRLMEFVARLGSLVSRLDTAAPATDWLTLLLAVIHDLTDTAAGDEWQSAQAIRLLTEALDGSPVTAPADPTSTGLDSRRAEDQHILRTADIRDLIATMIAARPTRANFRTGELTVCTLVPMRSVPHRVVVLLGIDADSFPRALRVDGDDILGRIPLLGERNPRDEDRQLFLDAVTAAQDTLLVFYTGSDPVSGTRVPSAVVVSELADAVGTLTDTPPDSVIIGHTLHGFDSRNFEPAAFPGIAGPLSFDRGLLGGARALGRRAHTAPSISQSQVDWVGVDDEVELAELIAFFVNPVEGFVRQRLGARMPDEDDVDEDRLEVSLGGLHEWAIGDRLLRRMLAGQTLRDCQMAELRRGTLPPAEFGRRELTRISHQVDAVHAVAAGLRLGENVSRDFVLALPDGTRIHGSIADVFPDGIIEATYSKVRAKQRLAAWIRLVALTAACQAGAIGGPAPDTISVVGRADRRTPGVTVVRLQAPDDPLATLTELVGIRRLGLARVLPLPLDAGEVYGSKRAHGSSDKIALAAAAAKFDNLYGANTDPYIRFVYGNDVTAAVAFDLLSHVPVPDDSQWAGYGFTPGESMFSALACTLWQPIVSHEVSR